MRFYGLEKARIWDRKMDASIYSFLFEKQVYRAYKAIISGF